MADIQRLKAITEFHRTRGLEPPEHPLISIVDYAQVSMLPEYEGCKWMFDFYFISLKRNIGAKILYGQRSYDFDEGVLFFIAPGQVFGIERGPDIPADRSGWILLVHPDFLWGSPLAKAIRTYDYFGYAIHEALFVSKKEEDILMGIVQNIQREYHGNLDTFSQGIIHAQLGTLLNYAERFHHRQFLTRKRAVHQVLDRMEELFTDFFNAEGPRHEGLPSVPYFADRLAMSPKYLSSMLKALTGRTAQQHIHEKLIERAKEKLSTTDLTVSEIAYDLGFEHAQSLSKLFKSRTAMSPLGFRRAFLRN